MKRIIGVLLVSGIAVCGCGGPEDPLPRAKTNDDRSTSFGNVETPPAGSYRDEAWFISDTRPVNRACNEPDYRPGQPETYPALDSPLYPVIETKQRERLAAVKALAPKVTDEDMYDLEADLLLRREINVLSQFVLVMGQDLAPRYLLGICDITGYETDRCRLMQRLSSRTVKLSNFEHDGDSLRYVASFSAQDSRSTLTIVNKDLDGLQQQTYSSTDGSYYGEWTRAADGTETFRATGKDGIFSYTEKPDCSGTAKAVQTDAGGHPWELTWHWSSVLEPEAFILQYSECKVNGLNERECNSGSI